MQRVLILGSPGAGKSTLAHRLAGLTGLPLIHLDQEYWRPGWTETPAPEWDAHLATLIARDRWIMDGNYGSSLPRRLAAADTVILLDYPGRVCLWRSLQRWRMHRGHSRPDMAADCPERLNLPFLWYVAVFRLAKRPRNEMLLTKFGGTIHRFCSPAALEGWLDMQPRKSPSP